MVGEFGSSLDAYLRNSFGADRVASIGSWGSSPVSYLRGYLTVESIERSTNGRVVHQFDVPTQTLENLMDRYNPTVVIIEQGANFIDEAQRGNDQLIETSVQNLIDVATSQGAQCIWIGPPKGRNKPAAVLERLYQAIRRGAAGRCTVLDSRGYMRYPRLTGDGRHYNGWLIGGADMARCWARHEANLIKELIEAHSLIDVETYESQYQNSCNL